MDYLKSFNNNGSLTLSLYENRLRIIDLTIFRTRNTLLHLDISKNYPSSITEQVHLIPYSVLSLDLGDNKNLEGIKFNEHLKPGIFKNFTSVEKLVLRQAGIQGIGAGTFSTQRNLLVLILKYNNLKNITGAMWEGLGKLRLVISSCTGLSTY